MRKSYAVGEEFTGGRSTALETVNFIDSLINCAIKEPGFIWNVSDADLGQWSGRLTRASARALRAKVWMFAASPLFNSNEPYMTYTNKPTGFENEEHVWFGKYDPSLWAQAFVSPRTLWSTSAKVTCPALSRAWTGSII